MPNERHYPWDILAIDETDDKKAIKKAYAVLIKQYKPDEYPEKFQEIHDAYQFALQTLTWNKQSTENSPQESTGKLVQHTNGNLKPKKAESNLLKTDSEDQQIADNLLKYLDELLSDHQFEINHINKWQLFNKYKSILDIQLIRDVSLKVFEKISTYNLAHKQNKKQAVIHIAIINYLDSIFNWSENWQIYHENFSYQSLKYTLYRDEVEVDISEFTTPITTRLYAFVVDFALASFLMLFIQYLLNSFNIEINKRHFILGSIAIFFISRLLFELLIKSNRSFGKIIVNLRILATDGIFYSSKVSKYGYLYLQNINGMRINTRQILNRYQLIFINFVPLLIYLYQIKMNSDIFFIMTLTIFIANVLAYFRKGALLHDLISQTRVLEAG
jgi:uncharacterized RDD family membrane protein YckC